MRKRGRPKGSVGTGKWGILLLERATGASERGKPIVSLVPDGADERMKQGLIKAATPLVRAGRLLRFKLWYPDENTPGRYLRTYICLPDARMPDGTAVSELTKDILSGAHPVEQAATMN